MGAVTRPPCISHVGVRHMVDIVRNADDAMLRAISERGGFVGIDFYPEHLLKDALQPGHEPATVSHIADHLLHAMDVCSEDHVGLGGDFDGFNDACVGLQHLGDLPNLERELSKRGLGEARIEKIFSGNLLRYLAAVLP